jgi:uncharacterized damage-inducible protein DinB
MKQVLQRMAEYNIKASDALLAVVEKAPAELPAKEVGLYYKSIDGTIEHVAWAFVMWLKRFSGFGTYPCLESNPLVAGNPADAAAAMKGNREKAIATLREAGALMARFVDELPVTEFERRVSYQAADGKTLERTMWHAMFHVLNHATHHRGEISAVLDQHGIANDCSGFSLYIH